MSFVFDQTEPVPVSVPIQVGESSFALLLNHPSIDQRITDDCFAVEIAATGKSSVISAKVWNRLSCASDWRDVQDLTGNPIPFTRESFLKLLGKVPAILDQLAPPLNHLFTGVAVESVPADQAA